MALWTSGNTMIETTNTMTRTPDNPRVMADLLWSEAHSFFLRLAESSIEENSVKSRRTEAAEFSVGCTCTDLQVHKMAPELRVVIGWEWSETESRENEKEVGESVRGKEQVIFCRGNVSGSKSFAGCAKVCFVCLKMLSGKVLEKLKTSSSRR